MEEVYQNALEEEFKLRNIPFEAKNAFTSLTKDVSPDNLRGFIEIDGVKGNRILLKIEWGEVFCVNNDRFGVDSKAAAMIP